MSSTHSFGLSPDQSRRWPDEWCPTNSFEFHKRHLKKREDAARFCSSPLFLFSPGPAADLQEASLIQTSPEERRGAGSPPKVSLLTYLERYGGYRGQREAGLSMWILASSDFSATKEFLALGVMALEQSVFDAGDWSLAYILAMVEDPPATMFSERMNSITAAGRPFSPLVPPLLASTNLSHIKELEVLQTRRPDLQRTRVAAQRDRRQRTKTRAKENQRARGSPRSPRP